MVLKGLGITNVNLIALLRKGYTSIPNKKAPLLTGLDLYEVRFII